MDVDETILDVIADSLPHSSKLLISGGVAGAGAKTATAPLSRLTILFQVHSLVTTKPHHPQFALTLPSAFRKVLNREGILAFWKGNATSVLHRFPYSAVNFFFYEYISSAIAAADRKNNGVGGSGGGSGGANSSASTPRNSSGGIALRRLFAGAVAGAVATVSVYPLDLIRTRLTAQVAGHAHYHGIRHAFVSIATQEGIRGLYRGLGTTLCTSVPSLALSYSVYGSMKDMLLHRSWCISRRDAEQLTPAGSLWCGAIAGIVASVVTFPIDVVRRRIQMQGVLQMREDLRAAAVARTPVQEAMAIVRAEGIRGMYRGLTPELLKVVPMVGVTFTIYEAMRKLLRLNNNNNSR